MAEFKLGQNVRVVHFVDPECEGTIVGQAGVVTALGPKYVRVTFDSQNLATNNGDWLFLPEEIELVAA